MTGYQAILLDIEGTTTSISFVYDRLFPFAKDHLRAFLEDHWGDPGVQLDIDLLREQSRRDAVDAITGVIHIPDHSDVLNTVVDNVEWQMANDRKTTGLKSLQGKIWKSGYASGELKAHIFDDVKPALERWKAAGAAIYIYSSGSVAAQRLLFKHTEEGDLSNFLDGYFDTVTGPKTDPDSYSKICEAIDCSPESVLFATDKLTEALAADEAGLDVVVMTRPGNPDQGEHVFRVAATFEDLFV